MAANLYVVLGATGHVGSIVASRLLDAGKRIRVVGRSAQKLAPLAARGAEVAAGSVDDTDFLRKAFDGAEAAFVMLPPFLGGGIRPWQEWTATAIGDALEGSRTRFAVTLSSIGADVQSGNGPVAGLHRLEQRLGRIPTLSVKHLRPGYFFENNLGAIGMIRATGSMGGALRSDLEMAHIASRDIGEAAAKALLALDWNGNVVQELHGERDLTLAEVAGAIGKAIGNPGLRYVQYPYAEALKGLVQAGIPEEMAALYMDMSKGFNEGHVRPTQQRSPITTTPTSIERWATEIFAPVYAASARRVGTKEAAAGHA